MITLNNNKLCENCFSETTSDPCPYCGFTKSAYRQDPITLAVGSVLNQRYMIGGVIGKGGFGITYLAYDLKLDARLAVKEYYPMGLAVRNPGSTFVTVSNDESEESFKTGAQKFYSEAKMVAKFNGNPNIVSVHDFFFENDTVYFTMGYLQGQTLKSYLKKKKLNEGQAVTVLNAISNALMASHSMNILHRDISPDNIMLCDDGTIRLLDFGAARQVMAEQSQSLSVILKQGFAPLEQYQKKGKQGPWTDIYALGATIYTALTGEMLNDPMTRLEDDSEFEANKHGISEKLWEIIRKCTQLKIQDRYQDIQELKAALKEVGVAAEPFTDIKAEINDILRNRASKQSGFTGTTGVQSINYAPAPDPNATMMLGGNNGQNRSTGTDENATVFLGEMTPGASNETVAMSPEEAAAYTAGKKAEAGQGGHTGQPAQGGYTGQPAQGGYTGQPAQGGYTGQPAQGGFTGQPGQGGYPAGGAVPGGQPVKKGIPIPAVIAACVLALGIMIFIVVMIVRAILGAGGEDDIDHNDPTEESSIEESSTEEDATGDTDTSQTSTEIPEGAAASLENLGVDDISYYYDETLLYGICYPSEYSFTDAGDETIELTSDDGNLHIAVRYMPTYLDGTVLYNASDFADMVNVRQENLLPVQGGGSDVTIQNADKKELAGKESVIHYEYQFTGNDGTVWGSNAYLFDSLGQFGCYVVYTLANTGAEDYDGLQDHALACADSFRVTGSYDPWELDIYDVDELGIKTSVTDGEGVSVYDNDQVNVGYLTSSGDDKWAYIFPADNYGSDAGEIVNYIRDNSLAYEHEFTTNLIPLDFGHYSGYWIDSRMTGGGETVDGRIYIFKTNFGSDAKYQSFILMGRLDDAEKLDEIVGGFRFEGATANNNMDVDTGATIEVSQGSSGSNNESEYFMEQSSSQRLSDGDVNDFLNRFLESNNAGDASEAERKRICARGLCYARNEIYARHGYIFNSSELKDLFGSKSWYEGTIPANGFNISMFNDDERYNVEFLKKKMEEYGGYQPAK
ncbi:MAG: protein kinase [Lachnospiraceae bacterium]|nr:protein kinase [Lachnospiraceae bacterium]